MGSEQSAVLAHEVSMKACGNIETTALLCAVLQITLSKKIFFELSDIILSFQLCLPLDILMCVSCRVPLDDPLSVLRLLVPDLGVFVVTLVTIVLCSRLIRNREIVAAANITSVSHCECV